MLMLLSVDVTSVKFLVRFNNFALTTDFYWSYTLLLKSPLLLPDIRMEHATPPVQYLEGCKDSSSQGPWILTWIPSDCQFSYFYLVTATE